MGFIVCKSLGFANIDTLSITKEISIKYFFTFYCITIKLFYHKHNIVLKISKQYYNIVYVTHFHE